jgi:uncharacterized protein YecE (DUF72 family)
VEIRHESFVSEAFIAQLRRHNIALVVADTAGKWPYYEDLTADFIYIRLHGDKELYVSGYTDEALEQWADRIGAWANGSELSNAKRMSARPAVSLRARDVYCYFDNDVKVRAPVDAHALMRKLRLPVPVAPAVMTEQAGAFVPESLDALPHALPRIDTRWRFGRRQPQSSERRHVRPRRKAA